MNKIVKLDQVENPFFKEKILIKSSIFEHEDLMDKFPSEALLSLRISHEERFDKDLLILDPQTFFIKYFKNVDELNDTDSFSKDEYLPKFRDIVRLHFDDKTLFSSDSLYTYEKPLRKGQKASDLIKLITIDD
jgi:hypothetical protein